MDAVMVEQFGRLYTNGWKPKKIMQELGIDYATYRKLFKEWKRQKEKEKDTKKEDRRAEDQEKDQEKENPEEHYEENDQEEEEHEEEPEYQESEENQEEEESDNESNEEERYRDNESQEESKNQSINHVRENIINKELEDFFDDEGELKVVGEGKEQESEDDEEDENERDINEIVGDAKETILFFVCLWLFLLAIKYPGDMMEKLDFVNSFIEKRERQIKRMIEKIDKVLRNYTKLYNMLAKANDWTFLMDITILTLTFKSELEDKFLSKQEEKKDTKNETTEYIELKERHEGSFGGRISLLLGGDNYVPESVQ